MADPCKLWEYNYLSHGSYDGKCLNGWYRFQEVKVVTENKISVSTKDLSMSCKTVSDFTQANNDYNNVGFT